MSRGVQLRTIRLPVSAALALAALAAAFAPASPASAERLAPHVPGELIVGFEDGSHRVLQLPARRPVEDAAAALERRDDVTFAVPNYIATAALAPLDVGTANSIGGWRLDQWSFLRGPGGIRVAPAWSRLVAAGKPGGRGVTIAVADTGIAYASTAQGGSQAPDFAPNQFVAGIDVIDHDERPLDENGHGTHVAATIGEQLTLGQPAAASDYLTGIAYGAKLMPIRVLDSAGAGPASGVGDGILWAARNGADVINVSLQFDSAITSCEQVPTVCRSIAKARKRGALVIAAAGNAAGGRGKRGALLPAAAPGVLGVGATTEHGCPADYSHYGRGVDLFAPGGGGPRAGMVRPECATDQRPVLALTLGCFPAGCGLSSYGRFEIRADTGTSMASAHASGVAALVLAARTAGRDPSPRALAKRLRCTARTARPRSFFGAGRLDALRAVRPAIDC